jgi:hypothetical protein
MKMLFNKLLYRSRIDSSLICDNSVNYNTVTTTTLSQLKMCDFSGETFKGFEVL